MSKSSSVDIPDEYTIKVGGTGSAIHVDADLDNIKTESKVGLEVTKPIETKSEASIELKPLEIKPLKVTTDSTSEIDVKPLAIDSCQTLKLAPLPPIHMAQPYSQHFGITFMGMELFGFNISGKSETHLHSPPKIHHYQTDTPGTCSHCGAASDKSGPDRGHPRSGLRVRVK
jgi:hypothetical protein